MARRKFEEQDVQNLNILNRAIKAKDLSTIRSILPEIKARRAAAARKPTKFREPKGRIVVGETPITARVPGAPITAARRPFLESLTPAGREDVLLRRETVKQRRGIEQEARTTEALERVAEGEKTLKELSGQPTGINFLQQIQNLFRPQQVSTEEADPAIAEINNRAQNAIKQGIDPQIVQDFRETAVRNVAIESLQSRNFPVTEGNIQEVINQLKQQPPSRRAASAATSGIVGLGAQQTQR